MGGYEYAINAGAFDALIYTTSRSEGRKANSRYIGKPEPITTEPYREDYPSRQAYRAAMRKWAAQQEPKP